MKCDVCGKELVKNQKIFCSIECSKKWRRDNCKTSSAYQKKEKTKEAKILFDLFINKYCFELTSRKKLDMIFKKAISLYLLQKGYSYRIIGSLIGADHKTVITNLKKVDNQSLEILKEFRIEIGDEPKPIAKKDNVYERTGFRYNKH